MNEVPKLIEMVAQRLKSPQAIKEEWLGFLEAYVLHRLDLLTEEERGFLEGKGNLDEFFNQQSDSIRHAVNLCVASNGAGLEELLCSLEQCELV